VKGEHPNALFGYRPHAKPERFEAAAEFFTNRAASSFGALEMRDTVMGVKERQVGNNGFDRARRTVILLDSIGELGVVYSASRRRICWRIDCAIGRVH